MAKVLLQIQACYRPRHVFFQAAVARDISAWKAAHASPTPTEKKFLQVQYKLRDEELGVGIGMKRTCFTKRLCESSVLEV